MGSNPLEQSFLVACSHDPPWLLLARWLAAAPLLNRHGSHRGAEGQPCFPLDYLYSPSDTQMQDGQGRAGHPQRPPGRGEVTQILLEQGLARMGYRWEAARLGLAEEQLPNVAWDLRSLLLGSQQGRPGRSAGSCVVAPRSDHFHQSGRDRSLRCKAKSRLQGWMPKGGYGAWRGGRGGLHLPLTCGGGHLGLPHREEQSQHLGLVPINPLTDTAQLQGTRTRTHALDHGQHSPEDTDEGDVGGRRRWGSKLWPGTRQSHPDQEPRGPWQRAGPAVPCPIASCPSPRHATLPGGTVGSGDPRGVTSPLQRISPRVPQTAKRTEKCLEKRETPRKPTPDKSSTSPPCPEHPCWPRATPQRKGGPGPGPAGVGGTQSTQARPIPALYTKA